MEGKYQKAEAQAAFLSAVFKNSLSFWSVGYAALVMVVEMVVARLIVPFVLGLLYARIVITETLAPVEHLMAGFFLDEAGG